MDSFGIPMKPFITFTSDFGLKDNYVAGVKGFLWTHLPEAILLDITHEIPSFSPEFALPHLLDLLERCPRGTIHLVVVDPGVGSPRRPLVGMWDEFFIVLPDNGLPHLLTAWIPDLRFRHLADTRLFGGSDSPTFQGRDLFAPAVVYLANGNPPEQLGPEISHGALIKDRFQQEQSRSKILVWNIDRFGNILLGYRVTRTPERIDIWHGETRIPYVTRYQSVSPGQAGCLINSSGWLEVFCREGNAAEFTGIKVGDRIHVQIKGGEGRFLA